MLRDETKKLLKEHGIRLSKRQGQPHVVDEEALKRMVDYAEVSGDDHVLEVGPGTGNLTAQLIKRAGKVTAVERDGRLVEVLKERFGEKGDLEVVQGDILETEVPEFDKVVANIPYSISSPLTFKLLDLEFELGVLMYQREFAQRMVASPGSSDYSRLSVNVAYRSEAEIMEEVSPESFLPRPKVWSAIVRIRPREPPFEVRDEDLFHRTVRAGFRHRRKKVGNSLFHSFETIFPEKDLSDEEKNKLIDSVLPGDLSDRRAGKISPEEFGKIADSLGEKFHQ